ncbi:dynamin family protein [Pseudomonas sp. CJQ_7]|jgi:predicted GTPase|uniref:dynamin family protein n=2 Tax=Pseudomonas TaxID=286 RepID=UPI00236429F4|nr:MULTISPECIES: dynamin family protein [Pseudomonas]EKT4471304.1 dynamin family protein [Pseudomonas putida]EKT4494124.1 dynamin family protein [Pseudomonas putida]EKT8865010.1 dynamin family protein [Pseudomonas putida]MDD2015135.1 dynamin family protein [Pseudomonas putida]MDH1930701.1 dynamin family protein [Pseudomonas sp. GD03696]
MSTVTRDELMQVFQQLQGQFSSKKQDLAQAQQRFDTLRTGFVTLLRQQTESMASAVSDNNPLKEGATQMARRLTDQFSVWEERAEVRAKGAEFRENYNDSLLVFVYGKVKSGKSSLGNYVAWGHSEPTAQLKDHATLKPTYFSHDRTDVASGDKEGEAYSSKQFRVGATEATSSIQGFKLPGFTWVDSPGLHSTNSANGDLARKYVDQADLILYTMNSQAPGRQSDMSEVSSLLDGKRTLMILLTGSDITDEDEDDDGQLVTEVLMKSKETQQRQILEVTGNLVEMQHDAANHVTILPISTRFAERHPSNLQESGLGTLYQTLKALAQGPGVDLKLTTPLNNLRKAIAETCDDLSLIKELTETFDQQIQKQEQAVERELRTLSQKGVTEMRSFVNQLFNGHRTDDAQLQLRERLATVLGKLTGEAIKGIGESQQNTLQRAFDTSRLGAIPAYREVTVEKEYTSGTRSSTKTAWGAGGAVLGGVIGFFVGGPAGAAAGASLGSAASMIGRGAEVIRAKHNVVVGDNLEEQRQVAIEQYANALPDYLTEQVRGIYEPLRDSMLEYCQILTIEMERLRQALITLETSTAQ